MRQQAKSKLFLRGVRRPIYLANEVSNVARQFESASTITVTTTDGDVAVFPSDRVSGIYEHTPRERESQVPVDTGLLYGVQVRFRSAAAVAGDIKPDDACYPGSDSEIVATTVDEAQRGSYVCVQAEDLAEALVLIVDPNLRPVFVNPAVPERSIRRYLKALRLILEAEHLVRVFNEPEDQVLSVPSADEPFPGNDDPRDRPGPCAH